MMNFIRKLLPPYGTSNDPDPDESSDEQDRCDHTFEESRETSQAPAEIALIGDHFIVIELVRFTHYCRDCGERDYSRDYTKQGRALIFDPAGAVEPDGDYVTLTEVEEYLARKDLSGLTNDNHPEPDVSIVNESENPEFEPDDGPARTETVEVGADDDE